LKEKFEATETQIIKTVRMPLQLPRKLFEGPLVTLEMSSTISVKKEKRLA
jgi:hypothetical protein